jgi:hypothetical protein
MSIDTVSGDIQGIAQEQIKLSKTYICFLLSNNEEKFLSELILWHCFMQSIIRLKARTVDFEKVRDDGEGLTH